MTTRRATKTATQPVPSNVTVEELIRMLDSPAPDYESIARAMADRIEPVLALQSEVNVLEDQMHELTNPEVRKAVVYRDGRRYFMLLSGAPDDDDIIARAREDGYSEREPLIWAIHFITDHEADLGAAAYPDALYREIDVWGNLHNETKGRADTAPVVEQPKTRTRKRQRVRKRNGHN